MLNTTNPLSVDDLLAQDGFVLGLAKALQIQLLASDVQLLERYRNASTKTRQKATQALQSIAGRLWEQTMVPGVLRSFVLQQFTSALESQPNTQSIYDHLARVLLPSIQIELLEVFSRGLSENAALQLSIHPTSYACARYLASLVRVWPIAGQYFQLPTEGWIKTAENIEVAWQFPPLQSTALTTVQHELRAKTLLLLVALAATARAEGSSEKAVFMGLSDLMAYFGYTAGERTNARYYWFHVAEIVRALLHDLPGHLVCIDGQPPQALLPPPQVVFRDPQGWSVATLLQAADLSHAVREADILGFYVRFEPEVLSLLGVDATQNTQAVPAAFCSLHGPCFWMAWRVIYWRHWSKQQAYPLLSLLKECGYLEAYTRNGRIRYKDALRGWWADVGTLIEIGLLHEPGVRIWRHSKDVSDHLSRQLEAAQRHIGPKQLTPLEVAFALSN